MKDKIKVVSYKYEQVLDNSSETIALATTFPALTENDVTLEHNLTFKIKECLKPNHRYH